MRILRKRSACAARPLPGLRPDLQCPAGPRLAFRAVLLVVLAALFAFPYQDPAFAQQAPEAWVTGQVLITGPTVTVEPASQIVPLNVGTAVNTRYADGHTAPPEGWLLMADLSGPAYGTASLPLQTLPNQPFHIPPQPVAGQYQLSNIRLVAGGNVTPTAPSLAVIQVSDIVISSVTSRPMTMEELQDSGIIVNQDDFKAYRYTVGLGLSSGEVQIDLPVLYSASDPDAPPIIPRKLGLQGPPPPPNMPLPPPSPELEAIDIVPFNLRGFDPDSLDDPEIPGLHLSGLLVFPSRITFLNQFFIVGLVVSNGAPGGSPLTLSNVTATIRFPGGSGFTVRATNPPGYLSGSLPILASGGVAMLGPGMQGQGEYDVTTPNAGTYTVSIDFQGDLSGLPSGQPVSVRGTANGVVVVRDPTFKVTFSHPAVVRQGDEYSLQVTISNTSQATANQLRVNLPSNLISGAYLLSAPDNSDTRGPFDLGPGESVTEEFLLFATKTGQVTTTTVKAPPGGSAQILLTTGVGDGDIPLSPDTLVLPKVVNDEMPPDLVEAALNFLGLGWSLATAPPDQIPQGLAQVSEAEVRFRANQLTSLARYLKIGEEGEYPLQAALAELTLQWLGNQHADVAFDGLRRLPPSAAAPAKGTVLAQALGSHLAASGQSVLDAHQAFAEAASVLSPHFSVAMDSDGQSPAPKFYLSDASGNRLGDDPQGTNLVREIPFGEAYPLASGRLLAVGRLDDESSFEVRLDGVGSGTVKLSVLAPLAGGLSLVTFQDVPTAAGSHARIAYAPGATALVLETDAGSISPSSTTAVQRSFAALGALQDLMADTSGRAVSVLFSHPVGQTSAEGLENYGLITASARSITGAYLQQDRRIVVLRANSAISPLVPNQVSVSGVTAVANGLPVTPATLSIAPALAGPAGTVHGVVYGEDGAPLSGAAVELWESDTDDLEGELVEHVTAQVVTDVSGAFFLDYVRKTGFVFCLVAKAPGTGRSAKLKAIISSDQQALVVALFMRPRGSVRGVVTSPEGSPAAGALVTVTEISSGEFGQTYTDYDGRYDVTAVPVGTLTVQARATSGAHAEASAAILNAGDVAVVPLYLVATQSSWIDGTVLMADGLTPQAGALVGIPDDGFLLCPAYANELGYFRLSGVPLGARTVSVYDPATFVCLATRTVPNLTADGYSLGTIILSGTTGGTGTVSGYLYSSGGAAGIPGATVYALRSGGGILAMATTSPQPDTLGHYALEQVPVGTWSVKAYDPASGLVASGTTSIGFPGHSVGLNLYLPGTGVVQGTVSKPASAGTACPAAGVRVFLAGQERVTGDDGTYQFLGVPLGKHTITAVEGDPPTDRAKAEVQLTAQGVPIAQNLLLMGRGDLAVTVRLKSDNTPVGALVNLHTWTINPEDYSLDRQIISVNSDPQSGVATVTGLLATSASISATNGFNGWGSENVTVRPATSTPVTVYLEETGFVEGTVHQDDGTTPVPHAVVTLSVPGLPDRTVVTDDDPPNVGRFEFDLVTPGYVEVKAEDPATGKNGLSSGTVTSGGTLGLDVRLLGQGRIEGTVSEGDGQGNWIPAANALVTLAATSTQPERTSTADLLGQFVLDGIQEGDHVLKAVDPNHQFELAGRTDVTVVKNESVQVTVRLASFGTVTGILYASDHATPVSSAQVSLGFGPIAPCAYSATGPDGRYTFDYVPLDRFFWLSAFDPRSGRGARGNGTLHAANEVLEIPLYLAGVGTLWGYVTSASGAAIEHPSVKTYVQALGGNVSTTGGIDGRYELPGLPEGTYTVYAKNPANGVQTHATGTLPTGQPDGQQVRLDLVMPPIARVEGTVYRADGGLAGDGTVVTLSGRTQGTTNGHYAFEGIGFGTYWVAADDPLSRDGGKTRVTVDTETAPVVADITLVGLGIVTGIVQTESGPLQATYMVKLESANAYSGLDKMGPYGTSENGTYRFESVRAGQIVVTAYPPQGSPDTRRGTAQGTLAPGQTLTLPITLASAGSVVGTVVDVLGAGIQGATVRLSIPGSQGGTWTAYTGNDGFFTFPVIPAGLDFSVLVTGPWGGYAHASGRVPGDMQSVNLGALVLDASLPSVVSTTPAEGAANVALDVSPSAAFSESLSAASVTATSVKLVRVSTGQTVAANVALSADGLTVTLDPQQNLAGQARYSFVLTTGLKDTSGNAMAASYTAHFETLDNVPPTVTGTYPVLGALQVPVETQPFLLLSEPLDDTTLAEGSFTLSSAAGPVNGSVVQPEPGKLLFTPAAPLSAGAFYTITVEGYQDLSGNTMESFMGSFVTIDVLPPDVSLIGPSEAEADHTASFTVAASDAASLARIGYTVTGAVSKAGQQDYPLGTQSATLEVPVLVPSSLADGSAFWVQASARDAAGQETTTSAQSVTVYHTPSLSLTSPQPGQTFGRRGQVRAAARVQPFEGTVSVTFYLNDEARATDESAPFEAQIALPEAGDQATLFARATTGLGKTADSLAVTVHLLPSARVTGTVYQADGLAAAGAQVELRTSQNALIQSRTTDAQGVFQMGFVPTGAYRLMARKADGTDGAQETVSISPDGATVTQDLTLVGTGTVQGRVVDADTDNGLGNATVTLTGSSVLPQDITIQTGSDGAFTIPDVLVGAFMLKAYHSSNGQLGALVSEALSGPGDTKIYDPLRCYPDAALVASISPADGATEVEAGTQVTVTFSQPVSWSTLRSGIRLEIRDLPFGSFYDETMDTWSVSGDGRVATLADPAVAAAREYRIQITGVKTTTGRIVLPAGCHFVTRTPPQPTLVAFLDRDTGAELSTVAPPEAANQVPANVKLRIAFDVDIDPATVNDEVVYLSDQGIGAEGSVSLSADNRTLEFVPSSPLLEDGQYSLQLGCCLADTNGDEWNWGLGVMTLRTVDSQAPQAQILAPLDQALVVDGAVDMPVRFHASDGANYCAPVTATLAANGATFYSTTQATCGTRVANADLPVTGGGAVALEETVTDGAGHVTVDTSTLQAVPWTASPATAGSPYYWLTAMAVLGRRAYLAEGAYLAVWQIDPGAVEAPQLLSSNHPMGAYAVQVAAEGTILWVLGNDRTLRALNVADPLTIAEISQTPIPNCAENCSVSGFALGGGYAYVADSTSTVHVLSLDNPSAVSEVTALSMPGAILQLEVESSRLAVLYQANSYRNGLALYEVTDPRAPSLLSQDVLSAAGVYDATSFLMLDHTVYTDRAIVDAQYPTVPGVIGRADYGMSVAGAVRSGAFLISGNGALCTRNVADPAAPFHSGCFPSLQGRASQSGPAIVLASDVGLRTLKFQAPQGGASLSIISPVNSAEVSAGAAVTVTAQPNAGYGGPVDLYVNGVLWETRFAAPYHFRYWVASTAVGAITFEATLVADDGQTVHSNVVTVQVSSSDVTPPDVDITSPTPDAWVMGGDTAIRYTTTDNVGVVSAAPLVGGVAAASTTLDGTSFLIGPLGLPFGTTTTLAVQAADAAGNVGTSPEVSVRTLCDAVSSNQAMEYRNYGVGFAANERRALLADWNSVALFERPGPASPVAVAEAPVLKATLAGDLAVAVIGNSEPSFQAAQGTTGGILLLPGFDLAVDGTLAVTVTSSDSGPVATVYDIGDPASPWPLCRIPTPLGTPWVYESVWLAGPHLLIGYFQDQGCEGGCYSLFAYSLSDPHAPVLRSQLAKQLVGTVGNKTIVRPWNLGGNADRQEDGEGWESYTLGEDGSLVLAGPAGEVPEGTRFIGDRFGIANGGVYSAPRITDMADLASPTVLYEARQDGLLDEAIGPSESWAASGSHLVALTAPYDDGAGTLVHDIQDLNLVFGDSVPPSVLVQSPQSGSVLDTAAGYWTVRAQASDDVGIASVSLTVNGALVQKKSQGPWTFLLPVDPALLGQSVTFEIKARDLSGNEASTGAQSVSIGSEMTGIRLNPSGEWHLDAWHTLDVKAVPVLPGGVDRVEFALNGVLFSTDDEAPYTCHVAPDPSQVGLTLVVDATAWSGADSVTTAGTDRSLTIHVGALSPCAVIDSEALPAGTWSMTLSPDGTLALLQTDEGLKVCELGNWNTPLLTFPGIWEGRIRLDGDTLYVNEWHELEEGQWDSVLSLVSLQDGTVLGRYTAVNPLAVSELSSDSRTVAVLQPDLTVALVDLEAMTAQSCCDLTATLTNPYFVGYPLLTPDGRKLVMDVTEQLQSGEAYAMLLVDLATGQAHKVPFTFQPNQFGVFPDGSKAWIVDVTSMQVHLVDLTTLQVEVKSPDEGETWVLWSEAAYHPSGAFARVINNGEELVYDVGIPSMEPIPGREIRSPGASHVLFEPHGRWSYILAPRLIRLFVSYDDLWPPALKATAPKGGTELGPQGTVTAYLSEPMDLATIHAATVYLTRTSDGAVIEGSIQALHKGTAIKWTPSQPLPSGGYCLNLSGLADKAGNPLAGQCVLLNVP